MSLSSAPVINERIESGRYHPRALYGAAGGRSGAVAAVGRASRLRLKVLHEQSVGASLGNDSIKSGIYASLIGFGLVVIGMLVYYKHSGLNASMCVCWRTCSF